MNQLVNKLPAEINKVLNAIHFDINLNNKKTPFYFASHAHVKLRGWEKAELNLLTNLNEIVELLRQDKYIANKDFIIEGLVKSIENIDLSLGFFTEAFYWKHRRGYLRIASRLERSLRPVQFPQFRQMYSNIKLKNAEKFIKSECDFVAYEKWTINNPFVPNPNIKIYQRLLTKINPTKIIRTPISLVYRYFNDELKLIYKNNNIRRNSIDLRSLCSKNSRGLLPELRFTPYGYISVPNDLKGDEKLIDLMRGGQVMNLAGGGGIYVYELVNDKYVFKENFIYWCS
jgi:hypothetical protein